MKKFRIEVTFSSGKFVAFPNVKKESVKNAGGWLIFTHGTREDIARIRLDSVDFIEKMEIDE